MDQEFSFLCRPWASFVDAAVFAGFPRAFGVWLDDVEARRILLKGWPLRITEDAL
jgi:hypothetical protein